MSHYSANRQAAYTEELMNPQSPQDISDYKRKWKMRGNHSVVKINSDWDIKAKDWCRHNLKRQSWSMTTWTGVYQHTIHFEHEDDATKFKSYLNQINIKGII